jgi:hypothetical protein
MTSRASVTPTDWITLDTAAALAFPDGTVSVNVLRAQRDKGRLDTWRLGRREYTTLEAVNRMKQQCHAEPRQPASGSVNEKVGLPCSSSSIVDGKSAQAAALASVKRLKKRLQTTSASAESANAAQVIRPRFGSLTS